MEIKTLEGPSAFLHVLGDSPRNRILDFLLGETEHDFTLKEIAVKGRVGYATIKRIWENFIESDLVKATRRVGKAVFYKYNKESISGKALRRFYLEILFTEAEKEAKSEQKVTVR